ncbi:3-phosphoshikimate 1-carboxyvinyltransferase [hydrothermal vent metagenome]|uniref:3-phosphoshikimate 1-carboxyvinyltransferase n=1 Tax=hydrothermal vent metagenome TaxID=652676 RepID=A0A3B0R3E1_9ZZZZ
MFASMAIGESSISGLLEAEDVINTAKAMAALGAQVERHNLDGHGVWKVRGVGVGGFSQPHEIIDFGNSGTGVRLCAGLVATTPIKVGFTGDDSLRSRPMKRITDPLRLFGAKIDTLEGDMLPMRIVGSPHCVPVEYTLPVASAQVKSAVLLAGLNAPGKTSVTEPVATRDHTEKMLKAFGAKISVIESNQGRVITVEGQHELAACDIAVPGDPSSAAFAIVAALITKNSQVTILNVLLNPTRIGLIDSLREMGGSISIENRRESGGEQIGDIVVSSSQLSGITVPAGRAPSMIDEYPVLAVAATFASGTTRMEGIGELRVKESDRLEFVADGLEKNGVNVRSGSDWLEVDGSATVKGGGFVATGLDHRIAMSFLVLGLATENPVTIDDGNIIATSFPVFEDLMRDIGCKIKEAEPGP